MPTDPAIRAALEAAAERLFARRGQEHASWAGTVDDAARVIAAFLKALPRDWRDIATGSLESDVRAANAITGWTEDTTRDGPETSAHWHAMRLAAAVEAAAKEDRT